MNAFFVATDGKVLPNQHKRVMSALGMNMLFCVFSIFFFLFFRLRPRNRTEILSDEFFVQPNCCFSFWGLHEKKQLHGLDNASKSSWCNCKINDHRMMTNCMFASTTENLQCCTLMGQKLC